MDRTVTGVTSWRRGLVLAVLGGALAFSGAATGATVPDADSEPEPKPDASKVQDLSELSLEQLMDVQVTTVSRTPQKASESAAAVYVITQDEIRRSGATTIAEALRLAPGMQVARVDSHQWAITARGFNDVFANKLLVMMDGRSVYTPLFSGVFWDVQDTFMEDIDRIEVIRGPGATMWGANAVNGVINIITKEARETQGLIVNGGGGTEEIGFGGLRYGGRISENAHYRVYGKYFNRDDFKLPTGEHAGDGWDMGRGGFRVDWEATEINQLTFQGDAYEGDFEQTFTVPTASPPFRRSFAEASRVRGGNLLGRWTHTLGSDSDFQVQMYYDRTERDSSVLAEDRDTGDIDFQHRFGLGHTQEIIWGVGYRVTQDSIDDSPSVMMDPDHRTDHLFSSFIQDEISLADDRVKVTPGTKFEQNDYTGVEIQPSLRVSWTPHEQHSVWAAVSRAVRTPSRAEDDVRINQPGMPPGAAPITGDRGFDSEELFAYELGYRVQPHRRVSADLALFYNDYDRLRSMELPPAGAPPGTPIRLANNLYGESYGAEISTTWHWTDWWRWHVGYTFLQLQMHTESDSRDATTERTIEGSSPHHQVFVRTGMDLPYEVDLNLGARYVEALPSPRSAQYPGLRVGSYVVADARLAWRPIEGLELSVVGQNLFDNQHPEFFPTFVGTQVSEVEHSVYGKLTWRF